MTSKLAYFFEMSKEDLTRLLQARQTTPEKGNAIEKVNGFWQELGKKMGFDFTTARPVPGKSLKFFYAVPFQTERETRE